MNNHDSPFDQYKENSVSLFLEPILHPYYKTYQQVITLSDIPDGPLKEMVSTISSVKLSPFQVLPITSNNPYNCIFVLCRYRTRNHPRNSSQKQSNYYMGKDDIPSIFAYLRANGYTIDTEITKMMNKSGLMNGPTEQRLSGKRQLICIITK